MAEGRAPALEDKVLWEMCMYGVGSLTAWSLSTLRKQIHSVWISAFSMGAGFSHTIGVLLAYRLWINSRFNPLSWILPSTIWSGTSVLTNRPRYWVNISRRISIQLNLPLRNYVSLNHESFLPGLTRWLTYQSS